VETTTAASAGRGFFEEACSMDTHTNYDRPSACLLALEVPLAALNMAALAPAWALLERAPQGDGHPVLVLPGLGASDVSTRILRRYLRSLDYHVHAWRLGRNFGPTAATVAGLRARVTELAERHARPLSLVGWSLGGIYAREFARATPSRVRQVITLGTPFRLRDRRASNAGVLFDALRWERAARPVDPRPPEEERGPLPVPATAVFTRHDGIVPWQACLEIPSAISESVEVVGSHSGLGHNPAAMWVVADRLALPEGEWKPFEPRGTVRLLFPSFRAATS
jgi:pimeloyl-ACP methyl ester carboxylesterase